jgi:hypothetical protein
VSAGLLVLALALSSAAEELAICGRPKVSTHPWSWQNIERRYPAEFAASDYPAVFDKLEKAFSMSPQQAAGEAREIFVFWLREIRNGRPCCEDFAHRKGALGEDDEAAEAPRYLFPDPTKRISLNCGKDLNRADQVDEIRYFADAFLNLGRLMQAGPRGEGARRIKALEKEFDAMLTSGFPMFPWEAALTSALLTDDELANGPPRYQAILFHAAPGFEVHTKDLASSRAAAVLGIEPFGLVRYDEKGGHKHWNALAALTTFRGDMGVGVGAAYHRDNLMLGLTWHDDDRNKRLFDGAPFVSLSVDLYQFLGEKLRTYDALRERFRGALKGDK